MSHSPESEQVLEKDFKEYNQNWEALYELVDEGRSWSGHERHCCFLNVAGGRFADISAFSNLDLPDDGRAVATCDWNHDGFIDFWISNRNGPRLRLLGNRTESECHFLVLRLEGTSCNRNAIGARVEVLLPTSKSKPIIKTLHAGDGYLAQSSKWLHFGLGPYGASVDIRVNWPDGTTEIFPDLTTDRRYKLVQHSSVAKVWQAPDHAISLKHDVVEPKVATAARTWIVGRLPVPKLTYHDWDGKPKSVQFSNRPTLLNLWSADCTTCMHELQDWSNEAKRLRHLSLDILALNVDDLAEPTETRRSRKETARSIANFGESGLATIELIDLLEITHRSVVELKKPLTVPCSFLFDTRGHLAAIYKGLVSVDTLGNDIAHLDADFAEQRDYATPFPGRWLVKPGAANPRRLIASLVQARQFDSAIAYLLDYLHRDDTTKTDELRADLHELHGNLLWDRNDYAAAAMAFAPLIQCAPQNAEKHREIGMRLLSVNQTAAALSHLVHAANNSDDVELQLNTGLQAMKLGQTQTAVEMFRNVLKRRPNVAAVHFYLGNLILESDPASAVRHYRKASRLEPNSPATANLAWLLATHSDPVVRSGEEAVEIALRLCKESRYQDVPALDALAAAYAETSQFDDAILTIEMAIKLSQNNAELSRRLQNRRQSYRNQKPYRE